jgi:predicted HNH restriction endonuclease
VSKPKRLCKICNSYIKDKYVIDGKVKNSWKRKHCFECLPFKTESENKVRKTKRREQNNKIVTSYRQRMKIRAIDQFGAKCLICGYDKCYQGLTFHHIDPLTKMFGISDGRTRRWEVILKEIMKCILVCHNCHAEIHAGLVKVPSLMGKDKLTQNNNGII